MGIAHDQRSTAVLYLDMEVAGSHKPMLTGQPDNNSLARLLVDLETWILGGNICWAFYRLIPAEQRTARRQIVELDAAANNDIQMCLTVTFPFNPVSIEGRVAEEGKIRYFIKKWLQEHNVRIDWMLRLRFTDEVGSITRSDGTTTIWPSRNMLAWKPLNETALSAPARVRAISAGILAITAPNGVTVPLITAP
jgi:hypothetical protein